MRKLKQLPITDLSLKFAEKVNDHTINIYTLSKEAIFGDLVDIDGTLRSYLKDNDIRIERPKDNDVGLTLDTIDYHAELPIELKSKIKSLPNKKFYSTVIQQVEFDSMLGKALYFVFCRSYKSILLNRVKNKINSLLRRSSYISRIMEPKRNFLPCNYFGFTTTKANLVEAAEFIVNELYKNKRHILGFLTDYPLIVVRLADLHGDDVDRYCLVSYVFLDNEFDVDLSVLNGLCQIKEGAQPNYFRKQDVPNYIYNQFNIPESELVFYQRG